MEKKKQSDVDYERFSIQGVSGEEIDGLLCGSIHHL